MAEAETVDSGQVDELKVARAVSVGLPVATVIVAMGVGIVVGPATSILVLAAGILLGVIAILWASLRILSGDAPLSPELAALETDTHVVDSLATRKKMLLRALKDLEHERSIGKIDPDDYEPIAATYRADLKTTMKRIDESIAPHRAKAEDVLREHLLETGLAERGYAGNKTDDARPLSSPVTTTEDADEAPVDARLPCPQCGASNEKDAKFCKECATKLGVTTTGHRTAEAEVGDEV